MAKKLTKYIVTARRIGGGRAKVSFSTKKDAKQYIKSIGHKSIGMKSIRGRMIQHPKDKSTIVFKPYKK